MYYRKHFIIIKFIEDEDTKLQSLKLILGFY